MNAQVERKPDPKGVERFNDGVQALLLSQPFFGTLLMKLRHVEEHCGTLYTDGCDIGYDSHFLAMQSIQQAEFVIAHEVLHNAWVHLDRIHHYVDTGIGPDGQPLDMALFNKALDYPINASLVESRIGQVPVGHDGKPFPMCLDPVRFPPTMTPEEVYCLLREQQNGGGRGKGGKPGSGKPGSPGAGDGQEALDQHRPKPHGATNGITEADVVQAANVCKAMRGTLPAGIDRMLGEIKRPTVSPWRRLRQFVTTSLAGYDSSTWRRLQRRMIVRGVGMPGRVQQGAGVVGIVVDTSGSIDDKMLQLFGGHMAAIMADARPLAIKVYWTDAKVHRVDDAKSATDLRRILSGKIPGGGGTDMPEGVQAAERDGCDSIVVLTDGYTPFCDSRKPLIWAITTQRRSPYGETVHISE